LQLLLLPKMKASQLFLALILVSFVVAGEGQAATDVPALSWEKWQPLIGRWTAKGKGDPGNGAGSFSFSFDLQNKVIVRKSHTEYPAAEGRPAFSHDDLMIIYADEASHKFRSDYFDNEGHVIRYTADVSANGRTFVLLSDPAPSQPAFRLTYKVADSNSLNITFEIAPPNTPGKFKTYLEGSAQRL
jgi:hypothetical protein